jgi:hypothetical protein
MDGVNTTQATRTRAASRRWGVVLLVAFLAAAITPVLFRQMRPRDLPASNVLLASVASTGNTIDVLLTQPIWSEIRGDGESGLAAEARAVRLGAAIAELEVRRRRADSTVPAPVADVVRLLQTFPDSKEAVSAFQSLPATGENAAFQNASELAERVAGRRAVRLGGWLQSARFAAATEDSSVFDRAAISSVSLGAISYDARPEMEHAVRQFEDIARERPRNWVALGTAVDELLRLLGTR